MQRLPSVRQSTDRGYVYVVRRGDAYKIGFSRSMPNVRRRTREAGGTLVALIPTPQRPAQLEYALNRRFSAKRLPPQGNKPGDKREWFNLDDADVHWLRGLAVHLTHNSLRSDPPSNSQPEPQYLAY